VARLQFSNRRPLSRPKLPFKLPSSENLKSSLELKSAMNLLSAKVGFVLHFTKGNINLMCPVWLLLISAAAVVVAIVIKNRKLKKPPIRRR
jgi:hypothetical protein